MIDTLIFDFDGTLIDYHYSDKLALYRVYQSLYLTNIDFNDFYTLSGEVIMDVHNQILANKIDKLDLHKYRLKLTLEHYSLHYRDDYLAKYRKEFISNTKQFDGVYVLLSSLTTKYKIGLLTNAYDSNEQYQRIKESKLICFFNTIVISGEINLYKPDPEILKYTLVKLKSNKENTIIIGDSFKHDIEMGKNVGVKTIHISNDNTSTADYVVKKITDITDIINKE